MIQRYKETVFQKLIHIKSVSELKKQSFLMPCRVTIYPCSVTAEKIKSVKALKLYRFNGEYVFTEEKKIMETVIFRVWIFTKNMRKQEQFESCVKTFP